MQPINVSYFSAGVNAALTRAGFSEVLQVLAFPEKFIREMFSETPELFSEFIQGLELEGFNLPEELQPWAADSFSERALVLLQVIKHFGTEGSLTVPQVFGLNNNKLPVEEVLELTRFGLIEVSNDYNKSMTLTELGHEFLNTVL